MNESTNALTKEPMNVLTVSITEAGTALARQLPYAHHHGDLAATVRERWTEVDAFVLVCATGVAVRVAGPLLDDKATDPGIVCVDDAGRFVIALAGGHGGRANELARDVAALLGAVPVVTTATDARGVVALDDLPGMHVAGDVARVAKAMLDGRAVRVENPLGWPLPSGLATGGVVTDDVTSDVSSVATSDATSDGDPCVLVTDEAVEARPHQVVLHPPSLVVGVGSSSGVPAAEVRALVDDALASAGLSWRAVAELATIDVKANEPGIVALGLPMRTFPADVLARLAVPNPSDAVRDAVGTSSVAEAAALAAAGPDAVLLVEKRRSANATVAVARRRRPRGTLALVGLGPGDAEHRTAAATSAVRHADTVMGYGPYVDLCASLLSTRQRVVRSPIGAEVERARDAVRAAASGERVVLVCSGDAGVYAMASLAFEVAIDEGVLDPAAITVVPGVTASLSASAALGAPLGHDHVSISLSDLLTPWPAIEARVRAAAVADLVVCFYNPRSKARDWQLDAARSILLEHRDPATPVGLVRDAGRPDQAVTITTLAELDVDGVDMTTLVVAGSSTTFVAGGRMITPRGYGRDG